MKSPAKLTELENRVYRCIVRAADLGQPCPKNDAIAHAVGLGSVGSASEIVTKIERKGWIEVHRGQASRVVVIVGTRKRTSGKIPKPHWRQRDPSEQGIAPRSSGSNRTAIRERVIQKLSDQERVEALFTSRDPCFKCGVRRDRHDALGCRQWQGVAL